MRDLSHASICAPGGRNDAGRKLLQRIHGARRVTRPSTFLFGRCYSREPTPEKREPILNCDIPSLILECCATCLLYRRCRGADQSIYCGAPCVVPYRIRSYGAERKAFPGNWFRIAGQALVRSPSCRLQASHTM